MHAEQTQGCKKPYYPKATVAVGGYAPLMVQERRRRAAAYLFFAVYILYLIEGGLRKWLLPSMSAELYFLRDPFVIGLYVFCWVNGLYERNVINVLVVGACIVTVMIGFIQYMAFDLPITAFALAVRSYWLYMPLIVVLPAILDEKTLRAGMLGHLIIVLPYAVLIVSQYFSEPTSFVNIGALSDEGVPLFAGGRGRPYGMFQYYSVNVIFVATGAALAIAAVPYLRRRAMEVGLLACGIVALSIMIALTGSRRVWFLVGSMLGGMVIGGVLAKGAARRTAVGGALALIGGVGGVSLGYERLWDELWERVEEGGGIEEGILKRIEWETIGFVEILSDAPIFGYGLGIGTSSVVRLLDLPVYWLGEAEGERVVWELGPIIGVMYLAARSMFSVWLVVAAFDLARRGRGEAVPIAILACVLFHSGGLGVSYSSVIGFQAWLAAGLTIALIKNGRVALRERRKERFGQLAVSKRAERDS